MIILRNNPLMHNEKNAIKKWLKKNGKDRHWLADQCLVTKSSIDNWFREGGIIPSKKLSQIRELMSTQVANNEYKTKKGEVTISFYGQEWELVQQYAKQRGMSIERLIEECAIEYTKERKEKDLQDNETQIQEPIPTSSPIQTFKELYEVEVIGNIAAGALAEGDTEPFPVKTDRPLEHGEYVLRVNGKSMEPQIMDGSLVVMRKHTVPPIPKLGTIVEYYDERGVTLKKLAQRKTEDGKKEYILHSINPECADILPMDGGRVSAVYVRTLESL